MIASVSSSSKIVVEKSTVPVKTAEAIEKVRACWLCCSCTTPICRSRGLCICCWSLCCAAAFASQAGG